MLMKIRLKGLNRQTMIWYQVQVDMERYGHVDASKWEDED